MRQNVSIIAAALILKFAQKKQLKKLSENGTIVKGNGYESNHFLYMQYESLMQQCTLPKTKKYEASDTVQFFYVYRASGRQKKGVVSIEKKRLSKPL